MARKITAGIIHPVTLFDADGNIQGASFSLAADAQVSLTAEAYSAGNADAPAANTAAVVTLPGIGGQSWTVAGIYWSYDDDPTGGQLTLDIGGVTAFTEYITSGGPGFFPFTPPIQVTAGAAVVITLAAGGAGISGSVSTHAWTE
jgi:hypothetical protein